MRDAPLIENLKAILAAIKTETDEVDNIEEKTLADYQELSELHKMKMQVYDLIQERIN